MYHLFEEIWRFKGLGLVRALLIAALIVGLRYYVEESNQRKKLEREKYIDSSTSDKQIRTEDYILTGVVIVTVILAISVFYF